MGYSTSYKHETVTVHSGHAQGGMGTEMTLQRHDIPLWVRPFEQGQDVGHGRFLLCARKKGPASPCFVGGGHGGEMLLCWGPELGNPEESRSPALFIVS